MARTALAILLTQAAAGAALTVILLILRRLLKTRVRPGVWYAAWLLVALRMILPVSLPNPLLPPAQTAQITPPAIVVQTTAIPASAPVEIVAVHPSDTQADISTAAQTAPLAYTQTAAQADIIHPLTQTDAQAYTQTAAQADIPAEPQTKPQASLPEQPSNLPPPPIPLEVMALLLWGAGILATVSYMVLANRNLYRRANLTLIDLPEAGRPVYLSDLPSPCVLGVVRPKIALTQESLQKDNLRYALLHETCHLRRRDMQWSLLRNVLCVLFWFSPFIWLAARASRRDCELACDEAVRRLLTPEERFDYAQTLLRLCKIQRGPVSLAATAMIHSKRDLKERLESIMRKANSKRFASALTAFVLALSCLASFATAQSTASPAPGHLSADQLIPKALDMLTNGMGRDMSHYPEPDVSSGEPGAFTFSFSGQEPMAQYEVDVRENGIAGVDISGGRLREEIENGRRAFEPGQIRFPEIMHVAKEFAAQYLNGGVGECLINPRTEPMWPCPGELPAQYNLLFPETGMGYIITVDLSITRVVQAVCRDMEIDENLAVVDKGEEPAPGNTVEGSPTPAPAAEESAYTPQEQKGTSQYQAFLTELLNKVRTMMINGMGVDSKDFPSTCEVSGGPDVFTFRLIDGGPRLWFEVDVRKDGILKVEDIWVGAFREPAEDSIRMGWTDEALLSESMQAAQDFAALYLYGSKGECLINPRTELIQPYPRDIPVQFNLLYPQSGAGYTVAVDLLTALVMQVEPNDMEVDENGAVVAKEAEGSNTLAEPTPMPIVEGSSLAAPTPMPTPAAERTYTKNDLYQKLSELENLYAVSTTSIVFRDSLTNYEPKGFWLPFAKALMKVDTVEDYVAFLRTRFPGINEAYPGHPSVDEIMPKVVDMLTNGMGMEPKNYPKPYALSGGPGAFSFLFSNGVTVPQYEVDVQMDGITEARVLGPWQEADIRIVATDESRLPEVMKTAQDFAAQYLCRCEGESLINLRTEELCPASGEAPAQFNLLFKKTGMGYIVTVDTSTMLVTQAQWHDMKIDETGAVVDKEIEPLPEILGEAFLPTPTPAPTPMPTPSQEPTYTRYELYIKARALDDMYGTGTGSPGTFRDSLSNYEPTGFWLPFAKTLMEVDTREEYKAFLNTRFPGINEAYPGHPSVDELMPKVIDMLTNGMGMEPEDYPDPYALSGGPGAFTFLFSGGVTAPRYEVDVQMDGITGVDISGGPRQVPGENGSPVAWPEEGVLAEVTQIAEDFAARYLYGSIGESVTLLRPDLIWPCPGEIPVQYILIFPETGTGYIITVDTSTMHVTQAVWLNVMVDGNKAVVEGVEGFSNITWSPSEPVDQGSSPASPTPMVTVSPTPMPEPTPIPMSAAEGAFYTPGALQEKLTSLTDKYGRPAGRFLL